MAPYFNAFGQFLLHTFIDDLLSALESAVDSVFWDRSNPEALQRITTNAEYRWGVSLNFSSD